MNEKEHAQELAEEAVKQAGESSEDTFQHYRAEAEQRRDDLVTTIRQKPLRTLAVAAAIGFVAGAIWKI